MKLRNKKTGEIIDFGSPAFIIDNNKNNVSMQIKNLAELNEEWEDYQEPCGWCITMYGGISRITKDDEFLINDLKEIGNYFNDKEAAYDGLAKLKAWKRLKDKGFNLEGIVEPFFCLDIYMADNSPRYQELKKDLIIVFGGNNENSK